jgi:hypothetical protein
MRVRMRELQRPLRQCSCGYTSGTLLQVLERMMADVNLTWLGRACLREHMLNTAKPEPPLSATVQLKQVKAERSTTLERLPHTELLQSRAGGILHGS